MKKCPNCGSESENDKRFCANCGASIAEVPEEPESYTSPAMQFQPASVVPEKTSSKKPLIITAVIAAALIITGAITLPLILNNKYKTEKTASSEENDSESISESANEKETHGDENEYDLDNAFEYSFSDDTVSSSSRVIPEYDFTLDNSAQEDLIKEVLSREHKITDKDGITYIDGIMIANKKYSLPESYDPGVDDNALKAFDHMASDAALTGLEIYISSDYRSYSDQERIYNRYAEVDGADLADTYSSRPGHSDHQTGLAFDLNSMDDSFTYTTEYEWLKENAHKYGFIIRYPERKEEYTGRYCESWHIRYVGVDAATEMYECNLCLEEYLGIDIKN